MEQTVYDAMVSYNQEVREKMASATGEELRQLHNMYMDSSNWIADLHAKDNEFYDKDQRRRIEEEKIKSMEAIEEKKQKLDWRRAALEVTKTTLPILGSAFCLVAGLSFAKQIEEDGTIKTNFSRQVLNQIPKIWNGR